MLRPATPLTLALLVSFVFLLLSTLSTPVVKSIPLAKFEGVTFGVFGFCVGDRCTSARVGYTTDGAFSSDDGDFQLPANTRHSLSSLLIVHPVAAFLNLIALTLAGAAHLHSPSHSARYLLGLLILLLPTLLVTLLAFLVDILLFVPHLQWGSWIVLASVICIAVSGVFTCAMRRTLVSRKARKKRIAENAEMSGENFYARQAAQDKITPTALSVATSDTRPGMINVPPIPNPIPSFASYDASRRIEEDRQPLNPARGAQLAPVTSRGHGSERYYSDPSQGPIPQSFGGSRPPLDQYGNPLPVQPVSERVPPPPAGAGVRTADPSPFREPDMGGVAMPASRQAYPPPGRGRGGYPPNRDYPPRRAYGPGPSPQSYTYGRGGYAGPPRGRGGFVAAGAPAGGAGGGMRREQNAPPPGYGPRQGQPLPDERDQLGAGSQYPPPEGYGPRQGQPLPDERNQPGAGQYPPPEGYQGYGQRAQSPARRQGSRGPSPARGVRAESPPPVMPNLPRQPSGGNRRPLPAEEPRAESPPPLTSNMPLLTSDNRGLPVEYVPVRSGWQQATPVPQSAPLPLREQTGATYAPLPGRPRVNSGGSDTYYEDVDPRFAPSEPMPAELPTSSSSVGRIPTPSGRNEERANIAIPQQLNPPIKSFSSYEDLPGARSPAESEASNFTSVSQRGVNPNWRPGYGPDNFNSFGPAARPGPAPAPAPAQQRRDVLLAGNPDFELPSIGRSGGRGGFRGGVRGGVIPRRPVGSALPPSAIGAADGPYPTAAAPPAMGNNTDVREV